MENSQALVLIDIKNGVATLTLNRPNELNALSNGLTAAIIDALNAVNANDEVQVVVITGSGKAFCAGVDLKELTEDGSGMSAEKLGVDAPMVSALNNCNKPIIGAINGPAVTGGFELALACDFLYAAESARFADTHARVGLLPGWGLSQKLPRLVGINRAREISFTGNFVSAQQAEAWGFVNAVVPNDDLMSTVQDIAEQIASTIPEALYRIKAMMNEGWAMALGDGLQMEGDRSKAYNSAASFEDMTNKLNALRQRSKQSG